MDNRKPIFTALGEIAFIEQKKKLRLYSPQHWQVEISKLSVGKKYGITIEEYKTTRSRQQLSYYWVLLGYLSHYSGHTPEELHDAIMRQKFGVKRLKLGHIVQEVRKSISDAARFNKADMVELITEVLNLCIKFNIKVPTKQELGYL